MVILYKYDLWTNNWIELSVEYNLRHILQQVGLGI